jgi:hypothetical protein
MLTEGFCILSKAGHLQGANFGIPRYVRGPSQECSVSETKTTILISIWRMDLAPLDHIH